MPLTQFLSLCFFCSVCCFICKVFNVWVFWKMYGVISRIFRENSITLGTYGRFTFYCSLRTEFPRLCQGILLNDPKYFKTLNPIHLLAPAAQVFTLSKSNETLVQSQQNSSRTMEEGPTSERIWHKFGSPGVSKFSYWELLRTQTFNFHLISHLLAQ